MAISDSGLKLAGTALLGLVAGGALMYLATSGQYNAQVAAITQAADKQIADTRAQLADARAQQHELALPDLPVRVSSRKALFSNGKVAQVHNFGSTELVIAAAVHSSASNQQNSWRLVIPAGKTMEIGQGQGWAFASGDELTLTETGFRPMKVSFP